MRPITSVHESVTADRVLRQLRERHSHQALVVDEFGGTAGILTLEDVLTELIGDVGDEFKASEPAPETLADGRIRLPGDMTVEDAAALLGGEWESDATTVGGLVTEGLGHLPSAHEHVTIGNYEFEVERVVESRRRGRCRAAPGPGHDRGARMIEVVVVFVVVLLLVIVNGLFVASEFAIVGAPRAAVEARADKGDRAARRVQKILEDPRARDRFIATAQIGISVASLALGMFGEHRLAEWLEVWLTGWSANPWITSHVIASVIAVAVLTYLHIVIGEMVPKALALQHATATALWVAPVIIAIQRGIAPLVHGLNSLGNAILSTFGVRRQEVSAERYHTTEELQFIIEESQEGGLLRGESGEILRELFEFGDLFAGEVMVPRVLAVGIPVGAEPDEVRAIVGARPHTRYPVYSGGLDNIIGSIHIKEVLRHLVSNRPVTARDARPVPYVPGPAGLDQVLTAMRRYRSQMAVVMDQHGGTAGLVTMEDLVEEVVGEIEEGRRPVPIVRRDDGGCASAARSGSTRSGEALDRELEHARVTTVSGLVLLLLGRPAQVGDVVVYKDVRFEVMTVAGRGVLDADVTDLAPPPPE